MTPNTEIENLRRLMTDVTNRYQQAFSASHGRPNLPTCAALVW